MSQSFPQRSLSQGVKHAAGRYGGFSFCGQRPDGVEVVRSLPAGTVFPNGATTALALTFDVEGNFGNGAGDQDLEIENYRRICGALASRDLTATFMVLGEMADACGPDFVLGILASGCEVATHGYYHELSRAYNSDHVYGGHYGFEENRAQVRRGVAAIDSIRPGAVRGIRTPYAHFNEFTYQAIVEAGLVWSSHVGIDDFLIPANGFGPGPFTMKLGETVYPVVEIPLDSQTFDWAVWMADERSNAEIVASVYAYCEARGLSIERSPSGAATVWHRRMLDAVESETVFTFLAHPINLTVERPGWGDPVETFLTPVLERAAELQRRGQVWVCTCSQLADFYLSYWRERSA